jgi:hypothetical protein
MSMQEFARIARAIPVLLLLTPHVAHTWKHSTGGVVAGFVLDANGDVVLIERGDVVTFRSRARIVASVRWRYGSGERAFVERVVPFPAGDVLAVGSRRPRSHRDGVFAVRLRSRNGKPSWRWMLDPPKARQQMTLPGVAVDAAGDVVIATRLSDSEAGTYDSDFSVIKLDGTSGEERWRASVAGLFHVEGIATDADGNVLATAERMDSRDHTALVKLEGSTGLVMWRVDLPDSWRYAFNVNVTADGVLLTFVDVATTPTQTSRVRMAKLSLAGGTLRWIAEPGAASPTYAAVAARGSDVVAAGWETGTATVGYPPQWFVVSAFDGATGALRWTYRSAAGDENAAQTLSFDADGNVVAAGSVWSATTCRDAFIVGLDSASGMPLWSKTIDGSFSTTNCHADVCGAELCPRVDDDSIDGLAIDGEGRITILPTW